MFSYSVKVYPIKSPKTKLLGFASLIIEDIIQIDGFKIFQGPNDIFVKAPSHEGKSRDGEREWYDDVKFLNGGKPIGFKDKESDAALCRDEIFRSIAQAFTSKLDSPSASGSSGPSRSDVAQAQSDVNASQKRRPLW